MKKFPTIFTALATVMVVWPEPAALAREKQPPEQNLVQNSAVQQEANGSRQFSKDVGALVGEALKFSNANLYQEAISILKNTLTQFELSPFEAATIHQMLGSNSYELDDYDGAILAFENAISSGGLLPREASNLRLNIAQLLIVSDKPEQGAQMLEDWATNGGTLQPKHIEILWQAWSQAEQYDRALPWAEKWFENANPKARKHFDLLFFIYSKLDMQDKAALIVEQIHVRWPDNKNENNPYHVFFEFPKNGCEQDTNCN